MNNQLAAQRERERERAAAAAHAHAASAGFIHRRRPGEHSTGARCISANTFWGGNLPFPVKARPFCARGPVCLTH